MQGVRRSQCWCSNSPAEAASPPVASVFVFLKADWVSWSINSVFSFHQQLKSLPVCLKPWINSSQLVTNRSVEVLTTKNGSGWFLKRVMPSDFYIIGPKIAVSCIICNLWDIIWASNSPTPPCHGIFFLGRMWKCRWRTIHLHFPGGYQQHVPRNPVRFYQRALEWNCRPVAL